MRPVVPAESVRWDRATRRRLAPAFGLVWDHLVVEDAEGPADAIFCFGSRHWRVPERAAALYHRGLAPLVVVTGGPAAPGEPTEAERFSAGLMARGVPADRIVREDRAIHTGQNVDYGLEALERHGPVSRLLIVAWAVAARRSKITFQHRAPGIEVMSIPALRQSGWRWQPTARRARFALGELDRLDRYGAQGAIPFEAPPLSVQAAAMELRDHLTVEETSAVDPPSVEVEAHGAVVEAQHGALLG